ncbi:hypothetical protein [uncultured Methylobacterium sp.]|uniref:hypothetical protein n=1 Tax=uncultured Methylobacterium sp. TaxID=157278 RepID=UPI0035CAA6EB
MHDVLVLPQGGIAGGAVAAFLIPVAGRRDVGHWIDAAFEEAARRADSGDPADAAVARLLAAPGADAADRDAAAGRIADHLEADADLIAAGPAGRGWAGALWTVAAAAVAEGRLREALALLAALVVAPAGREEGLLGLAVCAARLKQYEEARILALASRASGPGHPRALCVAGHCALELGDRRAAQSYLATAARIARRRIEFREDLRLAQRLLLLMHIA